MRQRLIVIAVLSLLFCAAAAAQEKSERPNELGPNEFKSGIIYGDGEQSRDFTYVTNAVDANLRAAESATAVGKVINVANGQRTTLNELLDALKKITGRTDVEAEYREPRLGDVRHSLADITRARDFLGYEPQVGLEEGLRNTLEWWKRSRYAGA